MAERKWQKPLHIDVISEILHLTENHPYCVNALCRRLWHMEDVPQVNEVIHTWEEYVNQQAEWITDDLSSLTLNRRKILTALAMQPTDEPQGQDFSRKAGLSPSAIQKSLSDLKKLDMIFIAENGYYHVLDPTISYFIRQNAFR